MESPIFENKQIDLINLPSLENLSYHGLAPSYLRLSYVRGLIFYLILLGLIGFLLSRTELTSMPWIVYTLTGFWVIITAAGLLLTPRLYAAQGYALREKDITFRKGVIFKTVTSIPFNRVQHCEIKQGPIERYFGLKTLEIFTAGGQSSDLTIPGLLPQTAQRLKEFIINRTIDDGAPDQ